MKQNELRPPPGTKHNRKREVEETVVETALIRDEAAKGKSRVLAVAYV